MLFYNTIRLALLRRNIRWAKWDVDMLTSKKPGDKDYDVSQQMLPLVKAELATMEQQLKELTHSEQ